MLKQNNSKTDIKEPGKSQEGKKDDFIFRQGKLEITFKSLDMSKWQCPFCKEVVTKLGQHINNKRCPIVELNLDKTEFTSQLGSFREGYRLDMSRKRKQRSRANQLIQKGPEIMKAEINQQKQKSRVKLVKEKGLEVIKAEINEQKQISRMKLIKEKGSEVIKAEMNEQKQKNRVKLKGERDPEVLKAQISHYNKKSRKGPSSNQSTSE